MTQMGTGLLGGIYKEDSFLKKRKVYRNNKGNEITFIAFKINNLELRT